MGHRAQKREFTRIRVFVHAFADRGFPALLYACIRRSETAIFVTLCFSFPRPFGDNIPNADLESVRFFDHLAFAGIHANRGAAAEGAGEDAGDGIICGSFEPEGGDADGAGV